LLSCKLGCISNVWDPNTAATAWRKIYNFVIILPYTNNTIQKKSLFWLDGSKFIWSYINAFYTFTMHHSQIILTSSGLILWTGYSIFQVTAYWVLKPTFQRHVLPPYSGFNTSRQTSSYLVSKPKRPTSEHLLSWKTENLRTGMNDVQ
jgi:hypothetical protein